MKIDYECPQCHKVYKKDKSSIYRNKRRRTPAVVCSECKYQNSLIECKQCKKKFKASGKNIFCSQSCAATYNNIHRTRKDNKKIVQCAYCKKETSNPRFCSTACSKAARKKINRQNHKQIIESLNNGNNLNYGYNTIHVHLKRYLIDTYGEKCCQCGWSKRNEFTGKIPIELDHIDGNCANNKLNNVRLLCPSCHSLTQHFKAGNKTYKDKNEKSPRYLRWKESFTK